MSGTTAGWAVAAALVVAATALSTCVERERAFLSAGPRDGPAPPGALAAPAPVKPEPRPVPVKMEPAPVQARKPDKPAAAPRPPAPPVRDPGPDWLLADRLPAQPPPAPPPAEEPGLDPRRLIGLSFPQIAALLGQPALRDERPPAQAWTYNAATCVLTIFFYPDIATREFRALTYELKTESASEDERGRCLRELRPRL